MSSNGVNITEDGDMAECEEEKVVTMMDVLQEQQEFEDDANAVLGASDDKNCTYSKGYIKRQAIYACLTCCVEAKIDPTKRAGVCLACSLNCHENHELIELYTKRNFRCDCGNPKFNNHPCQFVPEKSDLNEENNYNQNFSGLYCTCHRPYPDPEATFEDEMIQCIVCEDWLHSAHLETGLPSNDYAEMICKACMEKNEFLHSYGDIALNSESEDVDILADNNECNNVIKDVNGGVELPDSHEPKNKTEVEIAEAAIIKVETTTSVNVIDVPKADNLAEPNDEKTDEIVPKQEKSETGVEDSIAPKDSIVVQDNKSEVTDNGNTGETKAEAEQSTVETDNSKDLSTPNENQMDTEDKGNENSLIESIEKLENELGNVETKKDGEQEGDLEQTKSVPEAKSAEIDTKNQTITNETITSEEKVEDEEEKDNVNNLESNSQVESKEENKETIDSKASDVDMNEQSNSDTIRSEKKDDLDTVENGTQAPSELKDSEANIEETSKDIKRKFSTESEDVACKKPKYDDSTCIRPKGVKRKFKGATFWPSNFRQKLCTCNECISMYKDLSVLFLMDPEDTVTAYEALGRQKIDGTATSQYEKGLEALTSLDRIQQINALTEYNKMRDKLLDYLKSFKERKEIVKEEDIKAFFAGMKPKRESDGVYFCR